MYSIYFYKAGFLSTVIEIKSKIVNVVQEYTSGRKQWLFPSICQQRKSVLYQTCTSIICCNIHCVSYLWLITSEMNTWKTLAVA